VVNDGSFSDGLTLRREGSALPLAGEPGVVLNLLGLALEDPSKTALDSDALPPAAPSLAEFPTAQIDVTGCLEAESSGAFCEPGETLAVRALVTSLPEPGAASLAACVTLAILARTRGRLATPRAGAAADTPR
jgi:hypothetical protein